MRSHFSKKILTIEDDHCIRESIAEYLKDEGFEVIQAENGKAGLDIFLSQSPDLVLVDLRIPEIDGREVISRIATESPATPLIVVSGVEVINDAIESIRLGAWDYISKPVYDMNVLGHAIHKALERSRLLEENRRYKENLEEEIKKRTVQLEATNKKLTDEISERIRTEDELRMISQKLNELNNELEKKVRERSDELIEKNKQLAVAERRAYIGEMANRIAHELRNPLTVLGGFARRSYEITNDNGLIKKYLGIVIEEVIVMENKITELVNIEDEISA